MLDLRPAVVTRPQNWAGREAPRWQTPAGTSPWHRLLENITRPPQPRKTHALQESLLSFPGVPRQKVMDSGTAKSCRGKVGRHFSRSPQLSSLRRSLWFAQNIPARGFWQTSCVKNPPVSIRTSRESHDTYVRFRGFLPSPQ